MTSQTDDYPELIRLPNGTHADPRSIRCIHPAEAEKKLDGYGSWPPRVIVVTEGGQHICVKFTRYQDATAFADDLAEKVNAYRRTTKIEPTT